jgi:hypothetical protein
MNLRSTLSFLWGTLSVSLIGYGACFVPVQNPATDVESPGGTACGLATPCSTYQSCPANDGCGPSGCGWNTCVVNATINVSCQGYSNGVCDQVSWTCSGGTYTGPTGVMVTIVVLKGGGGSCGGCSPPGGGED